MNIEIASPFPTSTETGGTAGKASNTPEPVQHLAQRVHETVDLLQEKIGQGSEKVLGLQREYGDYARDQVRANPLAAVGAAFAAGYVFARLFSR